MPALRARYNYVVCTHNLHL